MCISNNTMINGSVRKCDMPPFLAFFWGEDDDSPLGCHVFLDPSNEANQ